MATIIQRPLRGSRISSFYPVKSLPSLASLDSAFQLQEYISLLIRLDVHDVDTIVSVPGKSDIKEKEPEEETSSEKSSEQERKNEITVDEACWIYEQLRRLAQDLSHPLITMLQQECNRASCPEMKAGEWLYLCVAHGNDGAMEQCCAIDYILHTLDSATALLNSPRAFPSRLQIPQTSHRHFSSLARRLGRIFAHAYFHHREAFEQAEAESSLYARFLALTSKFELVPAEFLVIPPRLSPSDGEDRNLDVQPPRLLAAGVNPQGDRDSSASPPRAGKASSSPDRWSGEASGSGSRNDRSKSTSPPGLGNESPRKVGRNRTDTMVFTEAYNSVVEELAKGEEETKADASSSSEPSEPAAAEEVVASPEDETPAAPLEVPQVETQVETQAEATQVETQAEAEAEAQEEIKTEAAAEPTPPPSEENDITTAEPSTEPSAPPTLEQSYASVLQNTPDAVETTQPEEKPAEEAQAPATDEVEPEPAAVPETREEDISVPEEPEVTPAPAPEEEDSAEEVAAAAPSSGPESTSTSEEKKEEEVAVLADAPPLAPVEEVEQTSTEPPVETSVEEESVPAESVPAESVPAESESQPEPAPEPVYLPVAVEAVVEAKEDKEDKEDAEPAAPSVDSVSADSVETLEQSDSASTAAPDQTAPEAVDPVASTTESEPADSGRS